jgi:hypothetical protein
MIPKERQPTLLVIREYKSKSQGKTPSLGTEMPP